ncbi:MAG: RpoL/Rpb11 RNA polymerase subunit family protein [Candidatus Hydrothermarchaeota archaeon]
MEIKLVEVGENMLEIEIIGEDHTFCNSLRTELFEDENVVSSAYIIEHPLLSNPKIYVITDGNKDPKQAFKEAAERLIKKFQVFRKEFLKSLPD